MNTLYASVLRAWNNWEVRLWPDAAAAGTYLDALWAGGLDEGMQSSSVIPYGTGLSVPAAWPVLTRGFFEDSSDNALVEELTAAVPALVAEAKREPGRTRP